MNIMIEQRLMNEMTKRNYSLLIPNILFLVCVIFLLKPIFQEEVVLTVPYFMISSSVLLRVLLMSMSYTRAKKIQAYSWFLYYGFIVVNGLGWGILFWFVETYFGLYTLESLFCIGSIITLISCGVFSFTSSYKAACLYLVSLSIMPVYVLIFNKDPSTYLLAILFIIYNFFHIRHLILSNTSLQESMNKEIQAVQEYQQMQVFIDAFPGLVVVVDMEETYIIVNNYREGFYRERVLHKKVNSYLPDSELTQLILAFLHGTETEGVHEVKSGEPGVDRWFVVNLKKISSPKTGLIAAIAPIDELVKAKNDLKIHEARSQYAAKLASLGEMAAGIAHEVNNPLTIIEGAANLMKIILKDNPEDTVSLEKSANKIMDTTQRIGRIIKSLRMLSGDAEEEPYTNFTFSEIVEPSLEISAPKIEAFGIRLTVDKGSESVELFGNEIQLSQVILNLVSNAIDAVKDEPVKWINISFQPTNEWIDILVSDSGAGVPDDIKSKIMDPFFTTKEVTHGTGLGLSISKNIVDFHNGELSLLEDSKHTTFRLRLPRMNPWKSAKKLDRS